MKKLLTCFLLLGILSCSESSDNDPETQEVNFNLVLYASLSPTEEQDLLDKLQQISERLFLEFNLSNNETFNVHIWDDYDEYLDAQQLNVGARYNGSTGYVFSMRDIAIFHNENMVETAEHEFVHVASMHLNSWIANNPRWLWEAVAIYEADEFRHPNELDYLVEGNFPTISELNGSFSGENAYKIYEVGYLLAEFIIDEWGRETYIETIKRARSWKNILSTTEQDFEERWKAYVVAKYLQ